MIRTITIIALLATTACAPRAAQRTIPVAQLDGDVDLTRDALEVWNTQLGCVGLELVSSGRVRTQAGASLTEVLITRGRILITEADDHGETFVARGRPGAVRAALPGAGSYDSQLRIAVAAIGAALVIELGLSVSPAALLTRYEARIPAYQPQSPPLRYLRISDRILRPARRALCQKG